MRQFLSTVEIQEEILFPAFKAVRPDDELSEHTPIYSKASSLDSIDLVSFILDVEQRIEEITGKRISLVDEKAFSSKQSPFETIGTLALFIAQKEV